MDTLVPSLWVVPYLSQWHSLQRGELKNREVTLYFANAQGFRGLLTSAGLASSQVFCAATLLAPFSLLHLRGPRTLYKAVVQVQCNVHVRVCVHARMRAHVWLGPPSA